MSRLRSARSPRSFSSHSRSPQAMSSAVGQSSGIAVLGFFFETGLGGRTSIAPLGGSSRRDEGFVVSSEDEDEEEVEEEGGGFKGGFLTPVSVFGLPPFAPCSAPFAPCSAPREPPLARAFLVVSSRTMRREKIVPSSILENTSASSNSRKSLTHSRVETPTNRAIWSGDIGLPLTVRWP